MSASHLSSTKAASNREVGHISRIQQSLEEKNIIQCNLLSQIEDELHNIKNLRSEQECEKGTGVPVPIDLIRKLDEGQETMHGNNVRLQDILNHIRSLV